jgi:hypothetical protein
LPINRTKPAIKGRRIRYDKTNFIFVVCCAIMGLSVPFYSGVKTALSRRKLNRNI